MHGGWQFGGAMLVQYEVLQACTEQHTYLLCRAMKQRERSRAGRVEIGGALQKRKNSGGCDRTDYRIRSEGDMYP